MSAGGLRLREYDATGDLAIFREMLADYGAERLRRIMSDGIAALEDGLAALCRVAAPGDMAAGQVVAEDAEECARLLQSLRIRASDAGFRSFSEACRTHERRARRGAALALTEADALTRRCRTARDAMERLLPGPAARARPGSG